MAERQTENELLEAGQYLRVSALEHSYQGEDYVRVVFRNKLGQELYTHMRHATYDSEGVKTLKYFNGRGEVVIVDVKNIYEPLPSGLTS